MYPPSKSHWPFKRILILGLSPVTMPIKLRISLHGRLPHQWHGRQTLAHCQYVSGSRPCHRLFQSGGTVIMAGLHGVAYEPDHVQWLSTYYIRHAAVSGASYFQIAVFTGQLPKPSSQAGMKRAGHFRCFRTDLEPLWHCVYSETDRISRRLHGPSCFSKVKTAKRPRSPIVGMRQQIADDTEALKRACSAVRPLRSCPSMPAFQIGGLGALVEAAVRSDQVIVFV